ncbi:MAG: hypothetical protein ACYDBV_12385 [Nitrospiria bacterium]
MNKLDVEWMSPKSNPDSTYHAFEVVNGTQKLTSVCGPPYIQRLTDKDNYYVPAFERIYDDQKCKACFKRVK